MANLEQLQEIFNEVFESKPVITEHTTKDDVSDWDSINHLSLILSLESGFHKKFSIEEIENTKSVKDILSKLAN